MIQPLYRNLDQELLALLRGASLECPVCGEFVLHDRAQVSCRECGMNLPRNESASGSGLQFGTQAG